MTFDEFDLDPRCLGVLEKQGIHTPTPVQEQAIAPALEGKDLIVTAQTGTGKTLGFCLPSLTTLARENNKKNRMLVLTPTRELCIQVESVASDLAKALKLRTALIYGGVGFVTQNESLRRGSDIIVATPGRLLDHMGRGNINFANLEILVIDEADRMLDMGFLPDIKRIMAKLPQDRQTLMFSATFADELERLAREMMRLPERITVGTLSKPVDTVRQVIYAVRPDGKSELLLRLLKETVIESAIIFLRTKSRTDRVGHLLKKAGYKAAYIHGDLSQKIRQRALDGFRKGEYTILVATDVAARGLDIEDISHVINYDIPPTADDYIHRIGRTARASKEGDAITFVCTGDHAALAAIEKALGHNLEQVQYEGAPPIISTWKPGGVARRPKGRSLLRRR